jgi:hypothetical protein
MVISLQILSIHAVYAVDAVVFNFNSVVKNVKSN